MTFLLKKAFLISFCFILALSILKIEKAEARGFHIDLNYCDILLIQINQTGFLELKYDDANNLLSKNKGPLDVPPTLVDGVTLVPIRLITDSFGAGVNWDPDLKQITIEKDRVKIVLNINSKNAYVDGKLVELEKPAEIINGNTMIPLRFIAESLYYPVSWNNETQKITITNSSYFKNKAIDVVIKNIVSQALEKLDEYLNTFESYTEEMKKETAEGFEKNQILYEINDIKVDAYRKDRIVLKVTKTSRTVSDGKLINDRLYQTYELITVDGNWKIRNITTDHIEYNDRVN